MGISLQLRAVGQESSRAQEDKAARHSTSFPGSAGLAERNRFLQDQLTSLRREHDDLRRPILEAMQMQRRLCGPRVLRREPFEIASELFPVSHLSGDFITVFELDTDLVFAIGDIGGKGLFAGMWFTYVLGMLRLELATIGDPAAAVSAINRNVLLAGLGLPLTTMLVGRLNLRSRELTYCSAGHPPALVLRTGGDTESLKEGGPVLGVLTGASYANGRAALDPGDTLLAYSDGIAECQDSNGIEFGKECLVSAAQQSRDSSASQTLFSVLGAAEDFTGGRSREDDIALIVIRRTDG